MSAFTGLVRHRHRSCRGWPAQVLRALLIVAPLPLLAGMPRVARADQQQQEVPSFAQLEAAGARVGEVRITAQDIFDTTDPKEDKALFRAANRLHFQTRPNIIERALLFKKGDPFTVRILEETERLLHENRFLYEVKFRVLAYQDGVVDIEVLTRDTWSLDLGASAGRSGGANSGGIHLKEYNLLGTGVAMSLGRSKTVDRTSREVQFSDNRVFGSRIALNVDHATSSDGQRSAASLLQPFYALDSRWAAGVTVLKDDRIDAVYEAGKVSGQYRHRLGKGEAFAGWSDGLVNGWVRRYVAGVGYADDTYTPEPGRLPPPLLPADEKQVAPFVRFELIEDRFARVVNRNLVGRPEFFALGLAANLQLGWAARKLGSSRDALLYSLALSRGFEPARDHTLTASAALSGKFEGGQVRRQHFGAQAKYYLPQTKRWLFYASAMFDLLQRPDVADTLVLGGDTGLRGYPLRYQSGTRSALFTLEERFYTDLYLWQLFRVGGAAFFDAGRAWGGNASRTFNSGWLSNVGAGLRIVSARAAFSNVLHLDLALPLNATPDMKKVQFLVKTKTSF